MKFWLSGEVMADVADAYRESRKDVEAYLNLRLGDASYGPQVERLVFVGVISSLDAKWFKELRKYHRGSKDAEFRLRIDHEEFLRSDAIRQRVLLCEALGRAIQMISSLKVNDFDTSRLLHDFEAAVVEKGWATSH